MGWFLWPGRLPGRQFILSPVFACLLCSSSSFRRKPESSDFALARHSSESWNPAFVVAFDSLLTASVRFSARIRASGSLFFACTKKSNQKKCTPGAALAASLRVRKVRPGFARWASCPFANSRASCARPCGLIRPALAAANGARRSRAGRKAKAGAKPRRRLGWLPLAYASCSCAE